MTGCFKGADFFQCLFNDEKDRRENIRYAIGYKAVVKDLEISDLKRYQEVSQSLNF